MYDNRYTVTLVCDFEADSPAEAASAMREFIDTERRISVTVLDEATGTETEEMC